MDIAEGQLILSTMLMFVNFILMAMLWTELCPPKNLYVEAIAPNVMVFGKRPLGGN